MKKLAKYTNKRMRKLQAIIGRPGSVFSEDEYHAIRVELKKLRFVADLVGKGNTRFNKSKIIKPFKNIFKNAGKVRDAQLEKHALRKYARSRFFKRYKATLQEQEEKGAKQFLKYIGPAGQEQLLRSHKKLMRYSAATSRKQVIEFLQVQKEMVFHLQEKHPIAPPDLHDLRKRLKKISYAERILDVQANEEQTAFNALSELLGKWHDNQVVIDHLNAALSAPSGKLDDNIFLESIAQNLLGLNDQYLFEINKKIRECRLFYQVASDNAVDIAEEK